MPCNQVEPHTTKKPPTSPLRPKRVVVSLDAERNSLLDMVLHRDCPIFLDTNVLLWGFGLNEEASIVWQKWLQTLQERLFIPAWVVHEYNQLSDKPEILSPYKTLSRKLQVALDELKDSAARALDSAAAINLGHPSKIDLERKLRDTSKFIVDVAKSVSRNDSGHRTELLKFYEELLIKCSLSSNIHETSRRAAAEFDTRSSLRLSPGTEDLGKSQNSCGDLIIWQEILQHCTQAATSAALFISNDVKEDWCYKPARVILENGKEVPGSSEAACSIRLPNPELITEFHRHTGSEEIVFATIEQVVEALSSTDHNLIDAARFSHLAQAAQSSRTPTDRVVDCIHSSEKLYDEGLKGVAYWNRSPDEVNMENFKEWCYERLKDTDIPFEKVNWENVFVALYL